MVVRELSSGAQRRISVPNGDAHTPVWSPDGTRLLFSVFFATQRSRADDPGFVIVNAGYEGAVQRSAVRHALDRHCVIERAAFDASGVAALAGCPNQVTAPARLIQLDHDGEHLAWTVVTGLCPNGATLVPDADYRQLLVTAGKDCGSTAGAPIDVVQAWAGKHQRQIGQYVNPRQFVNDAVW